MKEKIIKCKHCLGTGEIKIIPGKEVKKARLGKDLSSKELEEVNLELHKRVESLEGENVELKQGICEHIAKDELDGDCKLCDLAVAEKGYKLWVRKSKQQHAQINQLEAVCKIYITGINDMSRFNRLKAWLGWKKNNA